MCIDVVTPRRFYGQPFLPASSRQSDVFFFLVGVTSIRGSCELCGAACACVNPEPAWLYSWPRDGGMAVLVGNAMVGGALPAPA